MKSLFCFVFQFSEVPIFASLSFVNCPNSVPLAAQIWYWFSLDTKEQGINFKYLVIPQAQLCGEKSNIVVELNVIGEAQQ